MSVHRFVHLGDLHICSAHRRNADRLAALDQVIEQLPRVQDLAAILIPGDLYHQKSTVDDRNALAPRIQALARFAPVVITYGNHDEPGDLDIFEKLLTPYTVYVIDRPQVLCFDLAGAEPRQRAACWVLPYPHKAGLVAAGVTHGQLGDTARELLEAAVITARAELDVAALAGAVPLAMLHVNIGGAIASTGQPQIGREIELDPALLARLGHVYIAANHIHRHQTIHGATYAGSIARMDFGEREAKGFVEVEYQRDGLTWEHRWRFVPLTVPAQILVEGTLTREAFTITGIDGDVPDKDGRIDLDWRGADVRARYHYRNSEIGALDVAKIHAEFAGCRSLTLEPLPAVEHQLRAPAVAAATTLDGKVEAYCALAKVEMTDLVLQTLAELQGSPSETLLKNLQAYVERVGVAERTSIAAAQEVA